MEQKNNTDVALSRIEQKLDDLCANFDRFRDTAVSDIGFTRCALHNQELDTAVKEFRWFKRIALTGFSTLIGGLGLERIITWIK